MFSIEPFIQCAKNKENYGGKIVVVSGPTAVGKDFLLTHLPEKVQNSPVRRLKSVSTKKPRLTEGVRPDYDYVCEAEFLSLINDQQFLEYTHYQQDNQHRVYFGTKVDDLHAGSPDEYLFWKVSPNRLIDIIRLICSDPCPCPQNIIPVFIGTSCLHTLRARARKRATDMLEWHDRLKPHFTERLKAEYSIWQEHRDLLLPYLILNDRTLLETFSLLLSKILSKNNNYRL